MLVKLRHKEEAFNVLVNDVQEVRLLKGFDDILELYINEDKSSHFELGVWEIVEVKNETN